MEARVYSVEDVHVEALAVTDGAPPAIAISAKGTVNSTGWTHPVLAPRIYIKQPADGILDLDFIATAPTGYVLFVMSPISVAVAMPVPDWVRGVRVHGSTNEIEAMLEAGKAEEAASKRGKPGPWPFPWQGPSAMA